MRCSIYEREREEEREGEMSSHHRFRLSHLMPNSWFYKLRDMKRPRPPIQRRTTPNNPNSKIRSSSYHVHGSTTPKPLPLSPHQHPCYSSYLQTKRIPSSHSHHLNPKATDIQFPKDLHRCSSPSASRSAAIVTVDGADREFPGLQLRPIRTRPSTSIKPRSGGASCPSSPRLRSRRLHAVGGGARRRRSLAVVKASRDPGRDFRESMVEMIVENDLRAPEDLEGLLECYLSLNSREYHGVIMEAFTRIWVQITDRYWPR